MLNSALSTDGISKVAECQALLQSHLGDYIWNTPTEALHITLMDWLAPLIDYGRDKDALFDEVFGPYDETLTEVLRPYGLINVKFAEIRISPSAIFAVGTDDGQFGEIRKKFLAREKLLPNTKAPPSIIHFTISRFLKEMPVSELSDLISDITFGFSQEVDEFRLVREDRLPMLSSKVIKRYSLKGK